ncbi:MAG: aromatic ring-hydroxylating dioxygenase subunit alpha [Gammaproteobacteria bacterium]|nr:aromatic ring-hydroxylating dioxygenase subunit alpha [Gammaproteobacteria bacterium]
MSTSELIAMARHNLAHDAKGTMELAPDVVRIPAANYTDPDRFEQEKERIFKRVPLLLAASCELPEPGDYKAMEPVGVPVFMTRDAEGNVRAFLNSCSHRGAQILEGTGRSRRFICPYHGWSFDQKGALVGIASGHEFGAIDKSCHGLTPLPVAERSGLIWVILDADSTLDIDAFLSGYDSLLGHFGFTTWNLFESRTVAGPNWKVAYDGYLDLYHLPVLHKDTIGGGRSAQANYYAWGPHQRVISPNRFAHLAELPESEWPMADLMTGVWTIFPHISIASFMGGGRSVMLSQLLPGPTVGESTTTQYYLMENEPSDADRAAATEQFKLLEYVVQDEDYKTGLKLQTALAAKARSHVLFGRNESGGQNFHGWVDRILAADDTELSALFIGDQMTRGQATG